MIIELNDLFRFHEIRHFSTTVDATAIETGTGALHRTPGNDRPAERLTIDLNLIYCHN